MLRRLTFFVTAFLNWIRPVGCPGRDGRSAGRRRRSLLRHFHDDLLQQRLDLGGFLRRIWEIRRDGIHHRADVPNLPRQRFELRPNLVSALSLSATQEIPNRG